MRSNKQVFFNWLYRTDFSKGVLSFDDVLELAAIRCLGLDMISAQAFVAGSKTMFWNWTVQRCELDRKKGLTPVFDIVDFGSRKVVWGPYGRVFGNRDSLKCIARPRILKEIDALNDRQYEALACVIGRMLGANKWHLTPKGNEGGVDFFLMIPRPKYDHIFGGGQAPLRIIGQSKQHLSPVNVGLVERFITTIANVRCVADRIKDVVPNWFYNVEGPVIGWIVAHSGLQIGAQDTCRYQGIIHSSSLDLAEVAAKSRFLPEFEAPRERALYLRNNVQDVLGEFEA